MKNIFHILIDVLDTDNSVCVHNYMQHYANNETGSLEFDALLQDQRVWYSLIFCELWEELFKVYPAFPVVNAFLNMCNLSSIAKATGDFDLHRFQAFVQAVLPFWATPQDPSDTNALSNKFGVVKASFNASKLLAKKLSFRYGIFPPEEKLSKLISTGGLNTGVSIKGLMCVGNSIGVEVPNRISSLHMLNAVHMQCINAMNVSSCNPFNGLTRTLDPNISFRTVFDALAYCFIEPSVVLMIVGAHILTCTNSNIDVKRVMETISECIPNNRLIFIGNTHNQAATSQITLPHPIILHYMPKLAMSHLNVVPPSPASLTTIPKRYFDKVSLEICRDKMWLPLVDDSNDKILKLLSIVFCKNLMSYNVDTHALVFQQFLMRYYAQHRSAMLARFKPKANMRQTVMLIDSRENILSVMSILITFYNLSLETWSLTIVCNEQNVQFYKSLLGAFEPIEFVTQFNMPTRGFNIDMYNDMLKSEKFWEYMSGRYDKVLLIQDDGMLVRSGLEDAHWFKTCKYIGAPWCSNRPENKALIKLTNACMVGNGGLSVRDTRTMLHICKQHCMQKRELHFNGLQQEPEDVFFARHCNKNDIGTFLEASNFSSEQILNLKSFGFHKFWQYHHLDDVCNFFNDLLGDFHSMDASCLKLEDDKKGEC